MICCIAMAMLLPFIGMADFYSKGEPREAVVAYTMLENGNWILPINNGGDIPYKPPFFHWCIAFFSLLPGHVNEYTSRLPSALALIFMTMGGFAFFAKRKNTEVAMLASLLTLTSFEVLRAGYACRVDMVLTACIVGSMYLLYIWWEKGKCHLPWLAILCMSAGTLTKGPIGIILPCLVTGVFMLTKKERFWGTIRHITLIAILSMILPLGWYYAAYLQGGETFLSLVMEENFGRLMGKMSYESHENPAWYNLMTLIAGWLPYTLLLLFSLFTLPWKQFGKAKCIKAIRQADSLQLFVWLAFGLTLLFYCIPKSKRSTYLLPCYPFMAYLIAEYLVWMMRHKWTAIKSYATTMAALGIMLTMAFAIAKCGLVPESIFHGKHAADNIAYLHAIESINLLNAGNLCMIALPTAVAAYTLYNMAKKRRARTATYSAIACVIAIFMSLNSVYQPAVLNEKSDKKLAPQIEKRFDMQHLYSYIDIGMLHFFCLNFYLDDRIQQFVQVMPSQGVLMIPERDMEAFKEKYGKGYVFQKVWEIRRTVEVNDKVGFYQFVKTEPTLALRQSSVGDVSPLYKSCQYICP